MAGQTNTASPADSAAVHYQVDGVDPALAVRPGTREEVRDIVRLARDGKQSVIPLGAGTKLAIGMPPRSYSLALDMTRMNRVLAYDPGDLTISVEAGCRLRDLQAVAAAQGQFLPFEPPHGEETTIGGSLAANSPNLCREGYGTPRDFVLGMEFVTGEGDLAHSGGRVVKNVTGYDLHKLMIGSFGTLGAIVSINFRLYPLLNERRLFCAEFRIAENAFGMLCEIRASHLKPQTLLALDPGGSELLRRRANRFHPNRDSWMVVAIVRDRAVVLDRHERDLQSMSAEAGAQGFMAAGAEEMDEMAGLLREFTAKLREEKPVNISARIGTPPTEALALLSRLRADAEMESLACATLYQASGLAHLIAWDNSVSAHAPGDASNDVIARLHRMGKQIFEAAKAHGARAAIEWCPVALKSLLNVWGEPGPDFALHQKVKEIFDPSGIFSPGRFAGGL
jgi:glycolate oxidase FAD binding subunit